MSMRTLTKRVRILQSEIDNIVESMSNEELEKFILSNTRFDMDQK